MRHEMAEWIEERAGERESCLKALSNPGYIHYEKVGCAY
jgi:hypothetical protein